jgi:hypothetical protein
MEYRSKELSMFPKKTDLKHVLQIDNYKHADVSKFLGYFLQESKVRDH